MTTIQPVYFRPEWYNITPNDVGSTACSILSDANPSLNVVCAPTSLTTSPNWNVKAKMNRSCGFHTHHDMVAIPPELLLLGDGVVEGLSGIKLSLQYA